jgi:hypothetical protein
MIAGVELGSAGLPMWGGIVDERKRIIPTKNDPMARFRITSWGQVGNANTSRST